MQHQALHAAQAFNRRHFLAQGGLGLGAAALSSLLDGSAAVAKPPHTLRSSPEPRAKRIIYLFQSGAPSQIELFDHKPLLNRLAGTDLPTSVRGSQRLTGMTSGQASFPIAPSIFKFKQHGTAGIEISDLLPYTAQVADEL
jgi:hypothetical protein